MEIVFSEFQDGLGEEIHKVLASQKVDVVVGMSWRLERTAAHSLQAPSAKQVQGMRPCLLYLSIMSAPQFERLIMFLLHYILPMVHV